MSSEKNKVIAHKLFKYVTAVVFFLFVVYSGASIVIKLSLSRFWYPWLLAFLAMVVLAYLASTLVVDGCEINKSSAVTVLHAGYLAFLGVCMAGIPEVANKIVILYIGLFTVVELMTDVARCYDVYHGRSGPEWDRWWICTMIYPACGLLFEVIYWFDTPQMEVNQLYSVLAGFLSCTYMLSVYSQRLVPNNGPFKEIHGVFSGDRPRSGEGTCYKVQDQASR